ncbi:S8 family serine peptidase [Glaciecola sp. XM2]|uniref:S8 family serine peptidase n=1 Tax=Glaciecola sp. XM2 TaxID=1914931 RepID=UPI001BDED64B|nr:S8 family serine peptidase [Glaciecola sp. XM2]MBT1449533.1 S8 family serine peptidase [Glaciecola sp. XM2]
MKITVVGASLSLCFSAYLFAQSSSPLFADTQSADASVGSISPNIVKQTFNPEKFRSPRTHMFQYEADLSSGPHNYIVELNAPAVTDIPSLASYLKRRGGNKRLEAKPRDLQLHLEYLQAYQADFLNETANLLGTKAMLANYQYALNGMVLRMTQDQAVLLTNNPKVKSITRETLHRTETDRGPTLIGAPEIWQARLGNISQTQGEGVVVGIIDSGVNTDHPSFAELSGDGYTHTNPLGDGNFIGDCANAFPELCNNKLIGIRSYSVITSNYTDTEVFPPNLPQNGEDYGGHGTHVAAIAVGNVLLDVTETLPTDGEIVSDGTPTGFSFPQISGVAPRANLISYQVCFPGTSDRNATYADCPSSAIILGIEDAIRDGVDIINFSISGGGNPWNNITERAFLSALEAGIFVATSAGNSGPNPSTSSKHTPWYTAVGASEHGRQNAFVKQITGLSGGISPPSPITGQSDSGAITASIVYAGDFTNPNDPTNDSAQCLQPFPANTFSGQIVVCDRGEIARVDKAINVQAGGAGGYILANIQGGETFLANDVYVIPGIHINADDGDNLKQWLATGSNHRGTITAGEASQNIDIARVDVLGSFSSRGPNTTISTLTPTITAPGVEIYSAYADERYGHDGHVASAGDFTYLSGTSMSSPHVAGAGALLKALNPSWTPDNIRSALALTATTDVLREDATTPADYFDMGSGRIQVDQAAQAGLVMDETVADYLAANPALGGDPRDINLPSITDNACVSVCTWTREFTATKDGVWDVRGEGFASGLDISVSPQSFSILAGQTQAVEVTIDSTNAIKNQFVFGQVVLEASNSPDLKLPVSVFSSLGNIPTQIQTSATRDADSLLIDDIDAITLNSFNLTPYALVKATTVTDTISQDSNTTDYLDDLSDGVVVTPVTVPANAKRLVAEIVSSSAFDLDLFLVYDENGDGFISGFEELAQSISFDATEEIAINNPDAGNYFIIVQSFSASAQGADNFELRYAVVTDNQDDSLSVDAPTSLSADTPFDLRIFYKLDDAQLSDDFYGAIDMGTGSGDVNNLGMIVVDIVRTTDDVRLAGPASRVASGDNVTLEVIVAPNPTNQNRDYEIEVQAPTGTTLSNQSAGVSAQSDANVIRYQVTKNAGDAITDTLRFNMLIDQISAPGPIVINMQSEVVNLDNSEIQVAPPFTNVQVEGAPSLSFNGQDTTTLNVFETQSITIPLTATDPNNDTLALTYTQTEGPASPIVVSNGVSTLTAPAVDETTTLTYEVQVSDGRGNVTSAVFSVNVLNNEPPVIESVTAPTSVTAGQNVTISVRASDAENDPLTITIDGVAGSNRTIRTPSVGTSVTYTVVVSDGINSVTQTVTVNLTPAPVASDSGGGGSMPVGYLLLIALTALWRKKARYRA